jgi:diacylglycerol kinase
MAGIVYVVRTHVIMKIHIATAIMIIAFTWLLDIPLEQLLWVMAAIFFVMAMETVNTAVERTVDLVTTGYHPVAKLAKDIAAGAVLFSAVFATLTGIAVFGEPLLALAGLTLPISMRNLLLLLIFVFITIIGIAFLKYKRGNQSDGK